MQAERLLAAVDEQGADLDAMRDSFDAWCTESIAPWVRDHVEMDIARAARWSGAGLDLGCRCRRTWCWRPRGEDAWIGAGMRSVPRR